MIKWINMAEWEFVGQEWGWNRGSGSLEAQNNFDWTGPMGSSS
jgi:hypothetical protein